MRLSLWLILVFAFSVGMCCAFSVRFFYFEAMPVAVQTSEPTTKILVAKRMIPSGIEITADFVAFLDVPLSEVPTGSLTSFAQVYRRQPAYPIPADCPICEELLFPQTATVAETAFVPIGSRVVTFDVVHVRQGSRVLPPKEPLSRVLGADQRIDIRIIPPEAQGRLAEKKNEVIRTFGTQDVRNSGELVLENVPIHRIQRQSATDRAGLARDSLELMLDTNEVARLTVAAKRGQIRILVRQDERTALQPVETENAFETIDSSEQTLFDSLLHEQSLSLDIPLAQELFLPVQTETDSVAPVEHVQKVAPEPTDNAFDPIAPDNLATALLPPVETDIQKEEISQPVDQTDKQLGKQLHSSFVPLPVESSVEEETALIRNDGMIAFGTSSFRIVAQEQFIAVERVPTSTPSPSPVDESGTLEHTQPVRTHSEAVLGPQRSSTVQFRSPGNFDSVRKDSQEPTGQGESAVMPPVPSAVVSTIPQPVTMQERAPRYSPFERRIYTVLPGDHNKSLGEELQAPQRLLRSSDLGTQTR